MAKRKNTPDLTLRNLHAAKRREAALRARVKNLEHRVDALEQSFIRRFAEQDGATRG